MDVNISIIGKIIPNQPKAAPKAEVQLPKSTAFQPAAPAPRAKVDIPNNSETKRFDRVKAAAEAIKNTYAVSDTRFTIFKDSTGDYVTKFTSLRDGKVSYFPEKTMFELAAARNAKYAAIKASLDTKA